MKKTIKITDLSLIAALSLYVPIAGTEVISSKQVEFHFLDTEEVNNLISAYWSDALEVHPRQYAVQLKSIKTRIYGELQK